MPPENPLWPQENLPRSRVMSNTAALLASRLATAVMGWFGTLLIVRALSKTAWGQFSFVFNVLSLLYIVSSAVGPRVAIRGLLDRNDPGHFAGSYVALRSLLGVVAYAVAVAFVLIAGYPTVVLRAMALAGLVVVVSSTSRSYEIVFQVKEQLRQPAIAQALGQLAQLALTVILVLVGTTLVIFTIPAILCEVVILAWTVRAVRPLLRIHYGVILSTWGSLFRSALPIALGQGFFAVYANVDSILLSKLQSFQAVGTYSIAYKFSNIVDMIPLALSAALMGGLVSAWPDAPRAFYAALRRSFGVLLMTGALISIEFGIFAAPIVKLLYGDYGPAAAPARLVVAGACLAFFTVVLTVALSAQGRNWLYVLAGAGGLVVNVAANVVVIPRWSYNGAAWVTLLTEALVLGVLLPSCLRGCWRDVIPLRELLLTSLCGLVAMGAGIGLYAVSPWPIALSVSALLYVGSLHLLRVPGPQGIRSLMHEEPPG